MRRGWALRIVGATAWLLASCASNVPTERGELPYLSDAHYRRAALEASIVNPQNGYSALRLARYASGTLADWDSLLEWNPPTEIVSPTELDQPRGAKTTTFIADPVALTLPAGMTSEDDPRLIALGREAFARYPVQLAPSMSEALRSRERADHYGLWVDPTRGVGGLVRARMANGEAAIAMTCATCHAAPRANAIEDGLPNARFDLGAAILASAAAPGDAITAANFAAWGAGRLDVTTTEGSYPARIPDLRPVRWLTSLHQEATLRQNDRTSLAIRIETLIITSSGQVIRPPRVVALALAAYVWSLGDALPPPNRASPEGTRGAALFASTCAGCHASDGYTGEPVPIAVVGTDPWLGESPDRGTGNYRVPSLRGVGSRGPLLHDGTVASVDAMLDPERPTSAFLGRLHGAGPVPGHLFGLDLPDDDRAALAAWVKGL